MITALAITLYLECGRPERFQVEDFEGWSSTIVVTPVVNEMRVDGSVDWGFQIRGENWELYRIKQASEALKAEGKGVVIVDECRS